MKPALRKLRVLLEVWFAHNSAYRAEIVVWMLSGAVPLIMLAVWIGKARVAGGSVQGFTPPDFAAYFLAAWIAQQWTVAWVAWEVSNEIRLGTFSPRLLRPLDPIWDFAAGHVTERFVRLPFMVVIVGAGLLLVPGTRLTPDMLHALAFFVCIWLAFAMRFVLAYSIALLSFWFDQATALDDFYYLVAAFLTGGFAPLSFYPPAVRAAVEWTPFPYLVYYPVRVLTGPASGAAILRVFAMQLLWLAVFWCIRMLLWRRGLRRYGAVGA
jgi:ABC-2 type transport system permease protein